MDAVKILGSLLSSGALSNGSGSNVLGNLLGSALGGGQQQGGGMADVLGSLLGGGQQQGGAGMAGMLGSLLGGAQQQSGGGIGGMLGSMLSGQQQPQQGGGMADMLGSLLGGGGQSPAGSSMGGLGNLLGGAVTKFAQAQNPSGPDLTGNFMPQGYDQNEAEEQATLVIRAMINSAKADGKIDQSEQENIIGKLGDIDAEEAAFIRSEFQAPLDVEGFVRSVPRGMEQQIYALSLAAIDLDTQQEAQYLHQLGQGFGLSQEVSNQLHEQVGAPKLYS
uniref:Single-stranded DNA-binding protein n=1 Tax=uncultured Thiotrichaceae bacterium TaxID=298394 RepID=A0A6S6UEY5_9GAMM|nr:MAG: Single-stranded DNA-binding protein [uncultured Thiotrichaceae bacterium]